MIRACLGLKSGSGATKAARASNDGSRSFHNQRSIVTKLNVPHGFYISVPIPHLLTVFWSLFSIKVS